MLHHLEIWVDDLAASTVSLGWLLSRLGYQIQSQWANGISYEFGGHYIVLESGPDVLHQRHERRLPGLNHLAFSLPHVQDVEAVVTESIQHGFTLMFADKHPYAGGPDHYAAYLEDNVGFEVELVAVDSPAAQEKQQG